MKNMKVYWWIVAGGAVIFILGFGYVFYSASKKSDTTITSQSENEAISELDDEDQDEYHSLSNAEFEDGAIPLNDEGMSNI